MGTTVQMCQVEASVRLDQDERRQPPRKDEGIESFESNDPAKEPAKQDAQDQGIGLKKMPAAVHNRMIGVATVTVKQVDHGVAIVTRLVARRKIDPQRALRRCPERIPLECG
jgi:hypothetical protein